MVRLLDVDFRHLEVVVWTIRNRLSHGQRTPAVMLGTPGPRHRPSGHPGCAVERRSGEAWRHRDGHRARHLRPGL